MLYFLWLLFRFFYLSTRTTHLIIISLCVFIHYINTISTIICCIKRISCWFLNIVYYCYLVKLKINDIYKINLDYLDKVICLQVIYSISFEISNIWKKQINFYTYVNYFVFMLSWIKVTRGSYSKMEDIRYFFEMKSINI